MNENFKLPVITINDSFESIFSEEYYPGLQRGGMLLTEQISALNLRLRESEAGYTSDWHVAGDPTLIIIQQGCLRIFLRDQSYRDFFVGDAFIAKDYLPNGVDFDCTKHGHSAEVIGESFLKAVHIKLSTQA
jgi:hypothetical protein